MRADGTVLNEEGYDRASGMYFDPMCDFHGVPLNPTPEEVEEARTFLLGELLADFPFVSDADRANYVAALATPVLRRFIQGHEGVQPTPMLALNAVSPGTGKTLLANIIRLVFGGSLSEWTDDESELGKRVVSLLIDKTGAVCLLDNVGDGPLGPHAPIRSLSVVIDEIPGVRRPNTSGSVRAWWRYMQSDVAVGRHRKETWSSVATMHRGAVHGRRWTPRASGHWSRTGTA
ncbi:hypothetical protein SMICM304S_00923 [Streptomyces microflavus]